MLFPNVMPLRNTHCTAHAWFSRENSMDRIHTSKDIWQFSDWVECCVEVTYSNTVSVSIWYQWLKLFRPREMFVLQMLQMASDIHFSMWIKCDSPCGARNFGALCVVACLLLICVNVHNIWLLCVCVDASECISPHFSPVYECKCACVCMWACWGGLMGSVGARVLREQLSLIIQTRLIIKAAQISPWFHLNCRQAAPLRQAVVTLGRLSVFFSTTTGPAPLLSVLRHIQYSTLSQQDGLRLA